MKPVDTSIPAEPAAGPEAQAAPAEPATEGMAPVVAPGDGAKLLECIATLRCQRTRAVVTALLNEKLAAARARHAN